MTPFDADLKRWVSKYGFSQKQREFNSLKAKDENTLTLKPDTEAQEVRSILTELEAVLKKKAKAFCAECKNRRDEKVNQSNSNETLQVLLQQDRQFQVAKTLEKLAFSNDYMEVS